MIWLLIMLFVLSTVTKQSNSFRSFASAASRKFNLHMSSIGSPVRVRFAPSPTGSLHVGGARTALFNWLLARKTNGKFIIRVEDTDESRSTRASEESILNDLRWMNMSWDEGPVVDGPCAPYRQSERKDIYKKFAEQLIEQGFAYRCFCTEEELDRKRLEAEAAGLDPKYDGTWRDADPAVVQQKIANNEPYTVRFKVPSKKTVFIDDIVRGRVTWDADAMLGDFIILRSSGMPVYNFCVAVDDATMGITHVIRAEEHLSNTLRQLLILEALKYKPPTYAHCSLILGSDRSKLSKRHGATSVTQFSEQGFLPEAMMNYLANLGWNDGTPKEIYTPEELIKAFDMTRIIKSAAVFDMDKLKWINGQHIRLKSLDIIQPLVFEALKKPIIVKQTGEVAAPAILQVTDDLVSKLESPEGKTFLNLATKIAQRDMELIAEARIYVGNCLEYDLNQTIKNDEHVAEVLEDFNLERIIQTLQRDYTSGALPVGTEQSYPELFKSYIKSLGKELGLKGKGLFHPVRFALTGRMSGPDIGDQIQLLAFAFSSGVINPEYKIVSLANRFEQLKSLNIDEAKVLAAQSSEQRALEKKQREEEQARLNAIAAADAAAEEEVNVSQLVDQ